VRAVICRELGPPEGLLVEERESPPCGAHQIRVTVKAAGVNFVDCLLVQGQYQLKPSLPFTPGSEFAGVVSEAGDDVTGWKAGDRIFGSLGLSGAFADEILVPAAAVTATPDALSDAQAATFMQSYLTAVFALRERAGARRGESLLVLGAGGGIGLAAVDVGASMDLHVIAAASSDDKRQLALRHGAHEVIDTTNESLKDRARELTGGRGVNLVYDPVGGARSEDALRGLHEDGQLLVLGFASGDIPRLPANQILLRNRRVTGVDWGGWVVGHLEENKEMLGHVVSEIAAGRLHPVEPTTMPLSQAPAALRAQLDGHVAGKVALIPD
jgi:NADPH2:quinone reductase